MARHILINLDDELLADIETERDEYTRREQYATMARTGMIRTLLREALDARREARELLDSSNKRAGTNDREASAQAQ